MHNGENKMKKEFNIADLRWAMDVYLGSWIKKFDKSEKIDYIELQNKVIQKVRKYKGKEKTK